MTITATQLWQRIAQLKLATQAECRQWASQLIAENGPEVIQEPGAILAYLIRKRRLTPFQANHLMSGSPIPLVFDDFRMVAEMPEGIFEGWLEANSPNAESAFAAFLLHESKLRSNPTWRTCPPSLDLARQHAKIQSPYLLNFAIPSVVDRCWAMIALQTKIAPAAQSAWTVAEKVDAIRKIAQGLQSLHDGGLVHGRISLGQLGLIQNEPILLRDPLFPAHSPLLDPSPVTLGTFPGSLPNCAPSYAAPEFLVPGQRPNVATDLYALGCLWFHWMCGRTPFDSVSEDQQMAAHLREPIAIPSDLGLSDRLAKALLHLCAKNPESRFASAKEFLQVFDESPSLSRAKAEPESERVAAVAVESKPRERKVASEVVDATPISKAAPAVSASTSPVAKSKPTAVPAPAELDKNTGTITPPPTSTKTNAAPVESTSVASQRPKEKGASLPSPPAPPLSKPLSPSTPAKASRTPDANAPNAKAKPAPAASKPQVATPEPVPSVPPRVQSEPAAKSARETSDAEMVAALAVPIPPSVNEEVVEQAAIVASAVAPIEQPSLKGKTSPTPLVDRPNSEAKPRSSTGKKGNKKKKGKKSSRPKWVMPVVGIFSFLGICVLVAILAKNRGSSSSKETVATNPGLTTNNSNTSKPVETDPLAAQFQLQSDDGNLPWAPPRPASPHPLELIPPGAQAILFVKLEKWLDIKTGRSVMAILEEPFQSLWKDWEQATGVIPQEAKEVAIAVYPGENGTVRFAVRVELIKPRLLSDLKNLWQVEDQKKGTNGYSIWNRPERSYFVAQQNALDADAISRFVFGPSALIQEVADLEGAAGPLRRQLESLWYTSDTESDLALLMAPGFFFNEGKPFLNKTAPRMETALRDLFSSDVAGAYFTITMEPNLYSELRMTGLSEKETLKVSREMQTQFQSLADRVEAQFVAEPPHLYWRAVANRLPQMLRTLKQYQRFGLEQNQAITNAYLPSDALANLVLASWMSMQSTSGVAANAPTDKPKSDNSTPSMATGKALPVEEILARPIDLSFDQQALDTALNSISDEINNSLPAGTPRLIFEIDGGSFEREGITRNKEVRDFQFRQQPGRSVLMELATKANPSKVEVPTVDDQKVVWVILDDPQDASKRKVQFTTRKAAAAANLKLPKEFLP